MHTPNSRIRWTRLHLATVVAGLITAAFTSVAAAPSAHAADGGERCFEQEFSDSLKINKRPLQRDEHIPYSATYRWCAIDGEVTTFIVDGTSGEDAGVKVDIRPAHPLQWGSTYPIFINATKGKDSSHKEFSLTAGGAAVQLR